MGSIGEIVRFCLRSQHRYSHLLVPTVAMIALAASVSSTRASGDGSSRAKRSDVGDSSRNAYLGSAACSACHAGISKRFSRTSMGRSMSVITPELLRSIPSNASFYDEKHDRHFEVHAQDGKLYQSEFQTGSDQQEIFRDTRQLDWILGAVANGMGGLVQKEGFLFQAPMSFYSKPQTWGLSPGYEFGDYGFNRPILAGCIFCHSGRSRPIAATNGRRLRELPWPWGGAQDGRACGRKPIQRQRSSHREPFPPLPCSHQQSLHVMPSNRRRSCPQTGQNSSGFPYRPPS